MSDDVASVDGRVGGPAPARVVLASGSPRRRDLLAQLGLSPEVITPDVDETPHPGEAAAAYVARLAADKAATVAAADGTLVLAADTTVELDGELLGKPADAGAARRMLAALSGRSHRVHTGVAARTEGSSDAVVVTTVVTMARLDPATIEWYVATGEPFDKAGAYGVQGAGGVLVERVDGSVSNVVGLPLSETVALARRLGVDLLRA